MARQHSCESFPRTEAAIRAYEIGQRVGDRKARRELADEAAEAYELGRQEGLSVNVGGGRDTDLDLAGVEGLGDRMELWLAGYLDTDIPLGPPSVPGFRAWLDGRREGGHGVI